MSDSTPAAAYERNATPVAAADFYAFACDPRRNVAVEACAGAGKTWMLVSRIVRALFDGMQGDGKLAVSPHEILAITFTKRAASEMRERLFRWLEDFSTASDSELAQELTSRGVSMASDAQAAQAQCRRLAGLYRAVLACGRPVQIRTFHSWFAALLRAAPFSVLQQLALPLHYELLEDDKPARALVWRKFYRALLAQPGLRADFEAVVRDHGRFQAEKALSVALDKRIEFTQADAAGAVEGAVRHFSVLHPDLAQCAEPAVALDAPAARERWLAWASALGEQRNKTPQAAAQAVLQAFAAADPVSRGVRISPQSRLAMLRRAFFVADEDRLTQHLVKYEAAQQAAQELLQLCAAQRQHAAWLYQQRMAGLSRVLIAEFASLKRERGWVDMTDVERAAITLLSDPVLSGWVQERLDTRVRHLLIDEFQDTNPLQWQALLSWLGSYAGARGSAPAVFIVGDPKQSIYRFRRAEPQVFRAAQSFIAQALDGDLLSCDHTRRNARAVMDTVNTVMAAAQQSDHYEGFRLHTTSSGSPGQVTLLPAIARAPRSTGTGVGSPTDDGLWRDSLTQARELPDETLRRLEARQVAGQIAQAVAAGLRPDGVMVLSRRRVGLLPMQDELRDLGIAAQIGEKTALIDCCEVQDMVALLDVLVSPQHDLSLARVLRSPLFDLPDTALIALARRRRAQAQTWFDLLQQEWPADPGLQGVGATLLGWKALLDAQAPHDALQSIYSQHDVVARFAALAPQAQRAAVQANLRALLAASLQVAGGRFVSPYAFVRALKAGGVMAPAVHADNAVRLLTIHGAKGLEAPLVVLLDTDTPERVADTMGVLVDWPAEAAHPKAFFFIGSEARPPVCAEATLGTERLQRHREELNALYVAMTRARDHLLVSSIEPHRAAPGSWWQRLVGCAAPQDAPTVVAAPIVAVAHQLASDFDLLVLPQAPMTVPAVTAFDADEPGAAADDSVSVRVGKAMHRLLEWGSIDDRQLLAVRREFALDAEQLGRARDMARRILAGPGAWAWDASALAWQASEVELVSAGKLLRLDRLVQRRDNGEWWVLDYKSAHAPQRDPVLVAQLLGYRDAVQLITPAQPVRAAFLSGQGEWIEMTNATAKD